MAIKIGGTSIIDDNKNIANVGIITIGTGGTAGRVQVGTGATIHGSGNVSIAGTIYALDIVTPLKIDSFTPDNGQVGVSASTTIRITFDRAIGIGSTGYVRIKQNNNITHTFAVGSTFISRADLNKTLVITPSSLLNKGVLGAANTVTTIVDKTFINNSSFTGINTTGSAIIYKFETELVSLGSSYAGGYYICAAGGTQWIVAPSTTQTTQSWYSRGVAVTNANSNAPCGDWFVPSIPQLQNPGFACRNYWDTYSASVYWSNTEWNTHRACGVSLANGSAYRFYDKPNGLAVRAFRCISY